MTSMPSSHLKLPTVFKESESIARLNRLAASLYEEHCQRVWRRTDRIFVALMILQWLVGIAVSIWITPLTWIGATSSLHWHVPIAIFLGGANAILPITLVYFYPGQAITRHVVAITQILASSLLIHLTGGRIETHFHVFGSLAFLAFYRDWRILVTATAVFAIDHFLRGTYWPESVFGPQTVSYSFRWLEHVGWALFEDIFLFIMCHQSVEEMHRVAHRQAELEMTNVRVELAVEQRTAELTKSNEALQLEISERKKAEAERQLMGIQLQQAQKLESIGQLAAGIAHEINTPTQYVSDNTRFLESSFQDLTDVLDQQSALLEAAKSSPGLEKEIAAVEEAIEAADLDYMREEIPKAIHQSLQGLESISKIVRSMKDFSHPSNNTKEMVDLNRSIQSTVDVCRNEWKYMAEVKLDLDDQLPQVYCLQDEINQVILNIVVNATHAIEDVVGKSGVNKGTISISTKSETDWVEIRISDTGTGIPEPVRARIYDPFFTTKPVGKGTGQGLAIVYSIVTQKHQGTIGIETEMGKGTTFIIRLPVNSSN